MTITSLFCPQKNVKMTSLPGFSLYMFHHVPSCSIMFHHVPSCSINCQQNPSIVGVSSSHPPDFGANTAVPTAATAGETWWRAKQRADGCEVTKKNDSIITANLIIFPQSLMISRIYNGNMGNQPGIRAGKVKLHFLSKVVVKYSNIHKYPQISMKNCEFLHSPHHKDDPNGSPNAIVQARHLAFAQGPQNFTNWPLKLKFFMGWTWVISHVPMFHITQPLGINGIWSTRWLLFLVMSNFPKSWDIYQPLMNHGFRSMGSSMDDPAGKNTRETHMKPMEPIIDRRWEPIADRYPKPWSHHQITNWVCTLHQENTHTHTHMYIYIYIL